MMESFYNESMGLSEFGIDSVRAFSNKVNDYVTAYPKEKQNPLYNKIQRQIKYVTISFTLTIDTVWGDTIYYELKK